jgi:hypothetical protein
VALSPRAAALVREHAPRRPVQPRPGGRLAWDIRQAPPSDQEGLGNRIAGIFESRAATKRVRGNRADVLLVDRTKARIGLALLGVYGSPSLTFESEPHHPVLGKCPARSQGFTS